MSNINNEVLEGNKLIALFMGKKIVNNWVQLGDKYNGEYDISLLKYHSSWDSQIPAYSKIAHVLKELLPQLPNPETKIKYYFQQERLYQNAVFDNEPQAGQKVIVSLIKLYNQK
jgi:hypothetical protein